MNARVVIIGGTDSSGGAGLSRDAATLASLGVQGLPVVTAVTAQTNNAVCQIEYVCAELVKAQLECALQSGQCDAIKIGMLGRHETVSAVAEVLRQHAKVPIVLDPIIVSSSGTRLLEVQAEEDLKHHLIPLCEVVTPNLLESAMLTGVPIGDCHTTLEKQAFHFRAMGAANVLIKGGHSSGREATDCLFDAWGDHIEFTQTRLDGTMRGTGCMLASAIAGQLAQGVNLKVAAGIAQQMVGRAIMQMQ